MVFLPFNHLPLQFQKFSIGCVGVHEELDHTNVGWLVAFKLVSKLSMQLGFPVPNLPWSVIECLHGFPGFNVEGQQRLILASEGKE